MISYIDSKKTILKIFSFLSIFACLLIYSLINVYSQEAPKVDNKELAKKYFESGKKYIDEGNYLSAIFELEKALEFDPYLAPAWYNLGILYGKSEVIAQVNDALNKSIIALKRFLEVVENPEQYKEKINAMIAEREALMKKFKLANALQQTKNTEKIQNIYNKISSQDREMVVKELEESGQPAGAKKNDNVTITVINQTGGKLSISLEGSGHKIEKTVPKNGTVELILQKGSYNGSFLSFDEVIGVGTTLLMACQFPDVSKSETWTFVVQQGGIWRSIVE